MLLLITMMIQVSSAWQHHSRMLATPAPEQDLSVQEALQWCSAGASFAHSSLIPPAAAYLVAAGA